MRLIKKYYSLRYKNFDSMTFYLTQIKTLEERIRGINVILDDNKQTLLCLDITLPEFYQYYIKIWAMTLEIIANKTKNMLLEEKRRLEKNKNQNISLYATAYAILRSLNKRTPTRKATPKCNKYEKTYKDEDY